LSSISSLIEPFILSNQRESSRVYVVASVSKKSTANHNRGRGAGFFELPEKLRPVGVFEGGRERTWRKSSGGERRLIGSATREVLQAGSVFAAQGIRKGTQIKEGGDELISRTNSLRGEDAKAQG